jgi:hypothetical protein
MTLQVGSFTSPLVAQPRSQERARELAPAVSPPAPKPLPPSVRFADGEARARTISDARNARALLAEPTVRVPGALGLAIDESIEAALALRGAMPPSVSSDSPIERVIADQLQRARALPVRGVCLALPPLRHLLDERGQLSEDDARALVAWVEIARGVRGMRVVVLLDEADRVLSLSVPMRLGDWVDAAGDGHAYVVTPRAPAVVEKSRLVDAAEAGLELGEVVASHIGDTLRPPEPILGELALHHSTDEDASDEDDDREIHRINPPPRSLVVERPLEDLGARMAKALRGESLAIDPPAPVSLPALEARHELPELLEPAATTEEPRALDVEAKPAVAHEAATSAADSHDAESSHERFLHAATHRAYAVELDAARGPRPVAAIEKLFIDRYLPLLGAVLRGEADQGVRSVVEAWRQSFAQSYTEAFSTLRVTGKRPTMVFDAPEVASRVARLSSARSTKLVLVDSMSFELAERVTRQLSDRLGKRAALVDRTVLWSALPTRTPTQLHLIDRGPEGLKDPPPSSIEPDVSRGRNVSTLRRDKIGSREIYKLELVEARLRGPGGDYDSRLDGIATEIADVLAKLIDSLPPRTLVYVFGDHGFVLSPGMNGYATGPSIQGGASPEEVLVSGHGWLCDAVQ